MQRETDKRHFHYSKTDGTGVTHKVPLNCNQVTSLFHYLKSTTISERIAYTKPRELGSFYSIFLIYNLKQE
jgi:hypothetical protein